MVDNNSDIFRGLRSDFEIFWQEHFNNASQQSEPKFQESHSDEETEILKIGAELRATLSTKSDKVALDLSPVLEKLKPAAEKLQKYKMSLQGEMPRIIKVNLALITKDMLKVAVAGLSERYKVHWCGHLLHQVSLLEVQASKSYETLLETAYNCCKKLLKSAYNSEKRYLFKLVGFVSQIEGEKYRKAKDPNEEYAEVSKANTLYRKETVKWEDEKVKEYLLEQIDISLKRLSTTDCEKAVIGPVGGRLADNDCEIIIPEGGVKENVNLSIDITSKGPQIPQDYIPISPMMTCCPKLVLHEPAKIKLPSYCSTDNPDVNAIVMTQEEGTDEWTESHSEPLMNVLDHGVGFFAKNLSKFVVAIKNVFSVDAKYSLDSEVWFSTAGNFCAVFYVTNKLIKQNWEAKMEKDGFKRSQARLNPITVKGEDLISCELGVDNSKVVAFTDRSAAPFTVKESIARHGQVHYANFRLRILPVGNEQMEMHCVVIHKEEPVERVEWNLIWPAIPDKKIIDVFRDEIIQSFDDVNVWRKFADSPKGLNLTNREINHGINYDEPLKEQKMKTLLLWLDKKRGGGGKAKDDENEKQLLVGIREMTIQHREAY